MKKVFLFASCLVTACVFGEMKVSTGDVVPGEWNGNFAKAKAYAESNNMPMLIFWANYGCPHCGDLEKEVALADFVAWQKRRKLVMAYCIGEKTIDAYNCKEFVRNSVRLYPYMGVYWKKSDGSELLQKFTGRAQYMPQTGASLHIALMNSVDHYLSDWDPAVLEGFKGGGFLSTNTPSARLEADVNTTSVMVPLIRSTAFRNDETRAKIIATYPAGGKVTNNVVWTKGTTTNTSVSVAIPSGTFTTAGQTIGLTLQDDAGKKISDSAITYAPDRENSPKNPLWLGERTAESLAFGEWTMDLDVARAKTRATSESAYTLVLVGGSMWCPDCVKTDAYLIDTPQFKAWARENRVSCVAIDVPKMNQATPSLLTYDAVVTSDRYVTSTTPYQDRVQSGAGYLSRKMISPSAAATIASRNHHLLYDSTLNGGLCRPEKMGNTFKTGIPCLIIMRKDGTIAGRLDQFNEVSPDRFNPAHIDRLNEILALAEEAHEESNGDWRSTTEEISATGEVSATISAMDLSDVYKVTGLNAGFVQRFSVRGAGNSGVLDTKLSLLRVVGGVQETIKTSTGNLADGFYVQASVNGTGDYYIRIEALPTSNAFSIDKEGDSTKAYTLVGSSVANPGVVAFSSAAQTLQENGGNGRVGIRRTGGLNGACAVKIVVDAQASTADSSRYEWNDPVVLWADGEQGEKSVEFRLTPNGTYDGPQTVVLKLVTIEGRECAADLDDGGHVVTIADSDKPCFPQAAYVITVPLYAEIYEEYELLNLFNGSTYVKRATGALPSGLSLRPKKGDKTKAVLSGTPTKVGTYESEFVVKSGTHNGEWTAFTVIVTDPTEKNPYIVQKRKQDIPLMVQVGAKGESVLAGVLSVSITSRGSISARYSGTEKKAITFRGSWTGVDSESGEADAEMVSAGATLHLGLTSNGVLSVRLTGADSYFAEGERAFTGSAKPPVASSLTAYDGYYTVTLPVVSAEPTTAPVGTGFFTLTMRAGKATYSGLLGNGGKISGSCTASGNDGNTCLLNVFKRSGKDVFGAVLEVRKDASKTCTDIERLQVINSPLSILAYCLHRERDMEYLTESNVYGGYYVKGQAPNSICGIYGIDPELKVSFSSLPYVPGVEGLIVKWPVAFLHATSSGFDIDSASDIPMFKFAKNTGVFNGRAKLTFGNGAEVTGTFKGVLLPGWFGQCDECGDPIPGGRVTRPFASGTFYFSTKINGKKVVRSLPIDIDPYVAE